ncbi:hypothetical protein [Rhodanobacter sp. FW106-PBR-LB-2-11]|uniref:hypothetical protein n=1 Tax=Rhodanobacter sp. FW106-PBR-LB-2-11 TaxID=1524463 RepID=UPI0034E45DFD
MTACFSRRSDRDLAFLQQLATRHGPISDAQAERSAGLVDNARNHLYETLGRTTDHGRLKVAHDSLTEALNLDPRNLLAILFLISFASTDANAFGSILEDVAKRLLAPSALPRAGAEAHWSIGSSEQRDHMVAVAMCSGLLDDAGRYGCANTLRAKGLKLDKRDGSGLRYYVVAHALMVGDLGTVNRWLKWAKSKNQRREFWAWAETLALRISGAPARVGVPAFAEAQRLEPLVPKFMAQTLYSARELSEQAIRLGSEEEQAHHAAILHRAWAAHPVHFDWLLGWMAKPNQPW